jgi:hypothetical protein
MSTELQEAPTCVVERCAEAVRHHRAGRCGEADACLAFHQTHRVVRTASANEVRRPIYPTSVGRWKLYAHHLGPLFDALTG